LCSLDGFYACGVSRFWFNVQGFWFHVVWFHVSMAAPFLVFNAYGVSRFWFKVQKILFFYCWVAKFCDLTLMLEIVSGFKVSRLTFKVSRFWFLVQSSMFKVLVSS